MPRTSWRLAAALAVTAVACRPQFQLKRFTTNEDLYRAGLREYQRKKWDNAVTAFEKLTVELPARDSLLSRSFWYLANAHEHRGEHLLAAQSFSRLVESFPDDTLADDAALESCRSYRKLWRKPTLDPTYGETALAACHTMLGLYGETSPLAPEARSQIAELENWFAIKNYDAGMYYFRRKAYDSAIQYFRYVLERWPDAAKARDASLRLVEAFRAIRYMADASDQCTLLRRKYPDDRDVRATCEGIPDAPAPTAAAPPTALTPATLPTPPPAA
jgi:outer membrane assembly lipoprotein YfiO